MLVRSLLLASAALAATPAAAAPVRQSANLTATREGLAGGAWIGAVLFLLAASGLVLAYGSGDDAPASP